MLKYVLISALSALAVRAQVVDLPAVQTTGMIGIGNEQTAQLNLLNPGVLAPAVGVICAASVSFVDSTGAVLKTAILSVAPGKSLPFELNSASDISVAVGARREIRATITIPSIATPVATTTTVAAPSCKVIPTLEIFDNVTGRTLVTLGHVTTVPSVTVTPQ